MGDRKVVLKLLKKGFIITDAFKYKYAVEYNYLIMCYYGKKAIFSYYSNTNNFRRDNRLLHGYNIDKLIKRIKSEESWV